MCLNCNQIIPRRRRRLSGFTLVELLVVIGIITLLISILLPAVQSAWQQAKQISCANNVRQLVLSMMQYASNTKQGSFPRTFYDPTQVLQLDHAGHGVADTFGSKGYVGDNNVPAAMFILLRTYKLSPSLFVCPASNATPGTGYATVDETSNWEEVPDDISYSMATPYPTAAAAKLGFSWRNSLRSQWPLFADINPGTRGGTQPPNNVTGPVFDAPSSLIAAANSNNHRNHGQNVGYGDGHVEFQRTPYCGMPRAGGMRDNIYTAGTGNGGVCGKNALPVDAIDSVLLPTDDPGGK